MRRAIPEPDLSLAARLAALLPSAIFFAGLIACPPAKAQNVAKPRDAVSKPASASDVERLLPAYSQSLSAPAKKDVDNAAYKASVFGQIARANDIGHKTKGVPNAAKIHFVIGPTGALSSAVIKEKSGSPAFDAQVLAMIRKAAPFPVPPEGATRDFDASIKFEARTPR